MTKKGRTMVFAILVAVLAICSTGVRAERITLDTSAIAGGSYYMDFQLTNGDDTQNSSVSLTAFDFDTGSAEGTATESWGGATGDLGSGLTLEDTDFYNDVLWGFTPGASLSFDLALSLYGSGSTPDLFTFAILSTDGTYTPVPSLSFNSLNLDVFVYADSTNAMQRYAIDTQRLAPVPEPSALVLMGVGLIGLFGRRLMGRKSGR